MMHITPVTRRDDGVHEKGIAQSWPPHTSQISIKTARVRILYKMYLFESWRVYKDVLEMFESAKRQLVFEDDSLREARDVRARLWQRMAVVDVRLVISALYLPPKQVVVTEIGTLVDVEVVMRTAMVRTDRWFQVIVS